MFLKNWIEINYNLLEKEVITNYVVSVDMWLSDIEIVVKVKEGEDETKVIENAVTSLIRQSFIKIDNEIKEIEDKEYAEQLAKEIEASQKSTEELS